MSIIDDEGSRSTIGGVVCISDAKGLVPYCSCQSRLDIISAELVLRLHCGLQKSTNLIDVAENLPYGYAVSGECGVHRRQQLRCFMELQCQKYRLKLKTLAALDVVRRGGVSQLGPGTCARALPAERNPQCGNTSRQGGRCPLSQSGSRRGLHGLDLPPHGGACRHAKECHS